MFSVRCQLKTSVGLPFKGNLVVFYIMDSSLRCNIVFAVGNIF